jgi:hypothetical protein
MTSVLVTHVSETLARGMIGPRCYKVEGQVVFYICYPCLICSPCESGPESIYRVGRLQEGCVFCLWVCVPSSRYAF